MEDNNGINLSKRQTFSYSVGHVLNDLAASMWFSYLLVYFHQVKKFDNAMAGYLMMLGQISDAIFTPFIGYESDHTNGIFSLGKRKSWHLVGTICVICSFPFLFSKCITCENTEDWAQTIYYAPFVVIFQFGWASVQINHLALIPELTQDSHERAGLNGLRYAFTVLSNLAVYGIAWLLFVLDSSDGGDDKKLGRSDYDNFRNLVFIVVGLGCVFSLIFHLGVDETKRMNQATPGKENFSNSTESQPLLSIERSMKKENSMTWSCWLKEHQFYQVAVIYMCTRLFVNLTQVYLPFFLTTTLSLPKDTIAIVPLEVYVVGFITSLSMKYVNKVFGRKISYFLGAIIGISACVWVHFIYKSSSEYEIYIAAGLFGIGGTTMLVTSLTFVADLIKDDVQSGAFVYGAMSFTDKLSNGIAVLLVQQLHPCLKCCPKCVSYYRSVLAYLPGGASVLSLVALLTLINQTVGIRRRQGLQIMATVAAIGDKRTPGANSIAKINQGQTNIQGTISPVNPV